MSTTALRLIACLGGMVSVAAAQETVLPEYEKLQAQYDASAKVQAQQPYDAAVVDLKTKYVAALDRAQEAAQKSGNLEDVLALKADKDAIALGKGVPAEDDDKTPVVIKQLRGTYRLAIARLDEERTKKLQLLQAAFAKSLDSLVITLTKAGKISEATAVKKHRDDLAMVQPAPLPSVPGQPPAPVGSAAAFSAATKEKPFVNGLGMKFVPVPGTKVLFCIHTTRAKDYAAYAAEVPGVNDDWKKQKRDGIPISFDDDYPVVGVSWDDAQAFCAWLSKKERCAYRLPTDREWSFAVGIGRDETVTKDTTPEMLSRKSRVFPWGDQWPPPKDAGNFADTSSKAKFPTWEVIPGYTDGYPATSPVMSFKPNKLGLYDMSGNVWEWCEDWYSAAQRERVMRGGGWRVSASNDLLSGSRRNTGQDHRYEDNGFRVVVDREAAPARPAPQTGAAPPPRTPLITPTVGAGALKDGFTNTLGMRFMRVTGTKALFCIHTTRVKDYKAYATEVPGVNDLWKTQTRDGIPICDKDDHPVVGVSWDDANAFCAWLSRKEGRTYRLPTDREWSFAAGIGRDEQVTKDTPPESLNKKVPNVYFWGTDWPPPKGAGNFADESCKAKFPKDTIVEGYEDGFATPAPVMSFKPNKLGLYDLGGNVYEWCEDWFDLAKTGRVFRGASWRTSMRSDLNSSTRWHHTPNTRQGANGFRVVVESSAAR